MYIVGASTLGEIALGILNRAGAEVSGFYDDICKEQDFCNKPVIGSIKTLASSPDAAKKGVFIAIGDNQNRRKIFENIKSMNIPIMNIIDANAVLELNIQIGSGNLIMAGAYIGVKTRLGDGNLIFPGVSLTHHNKVGNFNFFSPNASVGGYTVINDECKIAMNCSVAPYINIETRTLSQPCSILGGKYTD
jgi:sugar O-acyltransferase (sialic acid O-acetyltransferase NeuD family)